MSQASLTSRILVTKVTEMTLICVIGLASPIDQERKILRMDSATLELYQSLSEKDRQTVDDLIMTLLNQQASENNGKD